MGLRLGLEAKFRVGTRLRLGQGLGLGLELGLGLGHTSSPTCQLNFRHFVLTITFMTAAISVILGDFKRHNERRIDQEERI